MSTHTPERLRCEVCDMPTLGDTLCNLHYEEREAMSAHTPGPWRVVHTADDRTFIDTEESNDNFIAQIDRNIPEYESNAAFIVRACNSHEAMLEALKGCERVTKAWLADMKDYPLVNPEKAAATMELIRIQEAIRLAEGRG